MTEEANAGTEVSGEDTAAVLSAASGEKTYIGQPEAEAPKDTAQDDPPGEDAAAAKADDGEGDAPKPKKMARERIDQLTYEKRELERQYQALLDRVSGSQKAPAQEAQPQQGDGRPDPANYDGGIYDPRYVEDLTGWKAETAVSRRLSEREAVQTVQAKLSNFESKAKEIFPDGEPDGLQAFRKLPSVPQSVADVLLASDIGPSLAEHLGDNPRELERISGLSPALQARELTLLETRLATPKEAAKPAPKTATDAPEPAPQARGAGGQFKVSADTNDFAAFEKQYGASG